MQGTYKEEHRKMQRLERMTKILICVCDDRISMLKEELRECYDELYREDIMGRISHYENIKREAKNAINY